LLPAVVGVAPFVVGTLSGALNSLAVWHFWQGYRWRVHLVVIYFTHLSCFHVTLSMYFFPVFTVWRTVTLFDLYCPPVCILFLARLLHKCLGRLSWWPLCRVRLLTVGLPHTHTHTHTHACTHAQRGVSARAQRRGDKQEGSA
jgi:hypothetical protein